MKEIIKDYIEKAKNGEELVNIAYELEQIIKLVGKKYVEMNINKECDDEFIEKAFLIEEFEEKLSSLLMCESSSSIYI